MIRPGTVGVQYQPKARAAQDARNARILSLLDANEERPTSHVQRELARLEGRPQPFHRDTIAKALALLECEGRVTSRRASAQSGNEKLWKATGT
jgi:hypothetical protein